MFWCHLIWKNHWGTLLLSITSSDQTAGAFILCFRLCFESLFFPRNNVRFINMVSSLIICSSWTVCFLSMSHRLMEQGNGKYWLFFYDNGLSPFYFFLTYVVRTNKFSACFANLGPIWLGWNFCGSGISGELFEKALITSFMKDPQ